MAEHIDVTALTQDRLNTSQHESEGQSASAASDGVVRNDGDDDHGTIHPEATNAARSQPRVTISVPAGESTMPSPMPLKPQRPPCFDPNQWGGPTVQAWLFALNVLFDANYVSEDTAKIRYAASLLRGPAMDWWRVIVTKPIDYANLPTREGQTGPWAPSYFVEVPQYRTWDAWCADKCVIVYLDDILIYSTDTAQRLQDIEAVSKILSENRLLTKATKCEFLLDRLEFLRHVISADGVEIDPKKITTIQAWHAPTNLTELLNFLGFVNYVRQFVPDMAKLTVPLTDLLRKGVEYTRGEKEQAAFSALKNILCSPPVLRITDPHRPFELVTCENN
ncbi:unnamed protein product [Closterium sp. NIES-53]